MTPKRRSQKRWPLLSNGLVNMAATATDSHATTEELVKVMFTMQSVLRLYNKDHR
jgi:hypothetical protein